MSRTIRWWQRPVNFWEWYDVFGDSKVVKGIWKQINPRYNYEKLYKWQRQKIHRIFRHNNKIRLQKEINIELEPKTHGWNDCIKKVFRSK